MRGKPFKSPALSRANTEGSLRRKRNQKGGHTLHVDRGKTTRKLARERVGQPPVERVITPKPKRKPKYPVKDDALTNGS
jgi:hypothetical protein